MDVTVIGASGSVGRRLLPLLVEAGHRVRGMIRDVEQAPEMQDRGAEPVVGDLEGEFAHLLEGSDAVVFTAGSGGDTGAGRTALVDGLGAVRAVNAARQHDVRRFVMISARGTENPDRSDALRHYLVAKLIADEYLERSGLDHTILRPGTLTDDPGTGRIRIGSEVGSGTITRDDVAATVAAALEMPETIGRTFELLNDGVAIEDALEALD